MDVVEPLPLAGQPTPVTLPALGLTSLGESTEGTILLSDHRSVELPHALVPTLPLVVPQRSILSSSPRRLWDEGRSHPIAPTEVQ